MTLPRRFTFCFPALASCLLMASLAPATLAAQQLNLVDPVNPALFSGLRWRMIGPFRGGRALTATGVPSEPSTFYFGAVGGGVWKTTNAGRTWESIFDAEPVASIGAIAVAPSDPNVIYVGSGEADMRSDISYGNGMYKSSDAGKTWAHIGLEDTEQIGRVLVDPHDPNTVFVAALGHAYGPNPERGVFRSRDGGKTWQKVLFKNENTGAIDLAFDWRDSRTIYAALWQTRRPPWNVYPPSNGPGSGLYKSTDGGDTWTQITGHGLPSEGLGRIGIAVAPTDPRRVYLIVDAKQGGLYRSDDAGANWTLADKEPRIWGRGWYFGGVTVDPQDPNTVYVCDTSTYRSRDGGKTFDAIKGAPGGDDYHSLWIYPGDPDRMVLSSDQGVVVSVDGAKTWTSWYNQPTAQFYHVVTTSGFPYWVCGAQQDSGAACTTSRSNSATISFRDWRPVGAGGESGYIAPDPLHPDVFYGESFGPGVVKYHLSTGQQQNVSPSLAHPGDYRHTWTLPLAFSPRDPHALYFGSQILFRTTNGGNSWQALSPDLTRPDPGVPPNVDASTSADVNPGSGKPRGVIYTIAPSPLAAGEIWVGTDDGLIQVTRDDGKTWTNVTPPSLTPWSKVGIIEASHYDADTAYAAVDRHRLDDFQPHIFRTRDGGKTWQEIARGIPAGSFVNAVRQDPLQQGLLFVGTETGVFVSFDDGDRWQPLQLNLPNVSVRDLTLHQNDLVIATHGRSFWILDDITPLRQLAAHGPQVAAAEAYLFPPETAVRVRAGGFEGTPLPFDVPQGENPPAGAILNYYLKSSASSPVTLEVLDHAGNLVRRYSSADKVPPVDPKTLDIPAYWIHPPAALSPQAGMHRFVWDLRYPAPPGGNPLMAMFGFGGGPWAPPSDYTVKLTVVGQAYTQPLTLLMDPRVKTPAADIEKQFEMAQQIGSQQSAVGKALGEAGRLRQQIAALKKLSPSGAAAGKQPKTAATAAAIQAFEQKLEAIAGPTGGGGGFFGGGPVGAPDTLRALSGALSTLENAVESADAAPTPDAETAFRNDTATLTQTLARWSAFVSKDLPALNQALRQAQLKPVQLAMNRVKK